MKRFYITYQMWHESFGGNSHKDGAWTITIQARNKDSAMKKAKRELNKYCNGQRMWGNFVEIIE